MRKLEAVAAAATPTRARAAVPPDVNAIRPARLSGCLRGLTPGRVGFALLICVIFAVRQHSLCVSQISCGMPDGQTLAGFLSFIARQFVFAIPLLLAITVADSATRRSSGGVRILSLSVAVALGAVVHGTAFLYTQPPNVLAAAAGRESVFVLAYSSRPLLYGGLATAVLYLLVRERDDMAALHAARLERVALDRQMIEARLQALQAQIEPHFLFNTLANIRVLYETESSRARPLIHDLSEYLRTALPQLRDDGSTLGRELDLATAYLRVLKVRMGERLNVVIDVPYDLRQVALPPMMVLTLVENAIKHGLAPLPRGGTITIRAERMPQSVRVAIIDDGSGFPKGFGAGVGLANTRARLTALYGENGRLTLDANPGGGVVAAIEVPHAIAATKTVRA